MNRPSRRSSAKVDTLSTLEHDALGLALQEALGGRVVVIRAIGQGGMGQVYLGRDPQLKRFVAIKVLGGTLGEDAEAHARFQREAQAIAAVSHPNVIDIYGVGELPDGTPYFVMQHVAGGSMAERIAATGPLSVEAAERVLGEVAAALAAAHRRGIIHRDVKPGNVLWDEEGERVAVSDFGIASMQQRDGDEADIRITAAGMTVGSPAYMSPEQLMNEPITPKSDVYGLGLLGYELLTGRGPYGASSPSELAAAHLRDQPRRLSAIRPDIPPALDALLLRCLAKMPDDRPSADEVARALTPGAPDSLEWPPPGLERMRGVLNRTMASPITGVICLLMPLVLFVAFDDASSEISLAWTFFLALSLFIGFVALVRTTVLVWQLAGAFVRAARLGYGWGTVAEVMSDRRGDTGALIAGTREYMGLAARERIRLRVLRVVDALAITAASPVALVSALVAVSLWGGEAAGASPFTWAALGPLSILLAAAFSARAYENRRLVRARRARTDRPRRLVDSELAPAWYAAFDRSMSGRWLSAGPPIQFSLGALLGTIGIAAALFCALVIFLMGMFTVAGQVVISLASPGAQQYQFFINSAQQFRGGISYRLPADVSVTPVDAGKALLILDGMHKPRAPSPLERRISSDYPSWSRSFVNASRLFPRGRDVSWTTAAIIAAGKGLTPEQRAFLDVASAHPARDELSTAARAERIDMYGALFALPFAEPMSPYALPTPTLNGVVDAAEAHAARVAVDIADGRAAEAERHARELIAVGSMLAESHRIADLHAAGTVLRRGVSSLEAVYIATGRERDARVLMDSVVRGAVSGSGNSIQWGPRGLHRAIRDEGLPRGVRFELLIPLYLNVCGDPKQLLFGIDSTTLLTAAYARDSLARFPSERVFVDAVARLLDSGAGPSAGAANTDVMVGFASLVDGVIGGRRFESCANFAAWLPGR